MVYCGEKPIAFEYHLNYEGVASPVRADFDEAYSALSPGAHLEYVILQNLFDDPCRTVREYNTCADGYAYELRWTDHVRPHYRAWVFNRRMYSRLLNMLALLKRPWVV
jgi:hypothetical protein